MSDERKSMFPKDPGSRGVLPPSLADPPAGISTKTKATSRQQLALKRANEQLKEAAKKVRDCTVEAYPIGVHINVILGGRELIMEVMEHTDYFHVTPSNMRVRNIATGKDRWIEAAAHDIHIIRYAETVTIDGKEPVRP